ncbi:hypothetical protein LSAT2_010167 [Lamellibrachia satsuma]|nr:hypothetical protein LSAT2_010167 [Lamellibrachia satsuma]
MTWRAFLVAQIGEKAKNFPGGLHQSYSSTREDSGSGRRYPCKFPGCGKTFAHETNARRHERLEHHFYRSRVRQNWWESVPTDTAAFGSMQSLDDTVPSDISALDTEKSQHETVPIDTSTTNTRLSLEDSVPTNTFTLTDGTTDGSEHETAKTHAQRQRAYRERKKAREGDEWLRRERERTRKYYRPTGLTFSKVHWPVSKDGL